jgi:DNA-binding response OmpR family regulator
MMRAERFTVLVVNDEPLLRRMLHASLRSSGFVEKARTAEEALAVMRERTFERALLYINVPRANGLDFCRQMRAPPGNRLALSWSAHRMPRKTWFRR